MRQRLGFPHLPMQRVFKLSSQQRRGHQGAAACFRQSRFVFCSEEELHCGMGAQAAALSLKPLRAGLHCVAHTACPPRVPCNAADTACTGSLPGWTDTWQRAITAGIADLGVFAARRRRPYASCRGSAWRASRVSWRRSPSPAPGLRRHGALLHWVWVGSVHPECDMRSFGACMPICSTCNARHQAIVMSLFALAWGFTAPCCQRCRSAAVRVVAAVKGEAVSVGAACKILGFNEPV